jgi:hypothetical protein
MWNKLKTLMDKKLPDGKKSLVASILGSPIIRSVSQHKKPEFIPKDLFAKAMVVEVAGDDYANEVNYEKLKKIETKFAVSEDLKKLWSAMIDELKADGVKTHRQLEAKVAKWFEYYEDRLSVWYKNHIRIFLLVGGLILSVAANIDSIQIVKKLWTDKELAENLALQGEIAADRPLDSLQISINRQTVTLLENQGLPVGWNPESPMTPMKFIGMLITAFAVSFGAPFWYELLQKIVGFKKSIKNNVDSN